MDGRGPSTKLANDVAQQNGEFKFKVVNRETKKETIFNHREQLTAKQNRRIGSYPDFIWQLAQRIKKSYAQNGEDVSVYVDAKASVNGKPFRTFIDPEVDLATTKWNYFWHNEWILPSKKDEIPK